MGRGLHQAWQGVTLRRTPSLPHACMALRPTWLTQTSTTLQVSRHIQPATLRSVATVCATSALPPPGHGDGVPPAAAGTRGRGVMGRRSHEWGCRGVSQYSGTHVSLVTLPLIAQSSLVVHHCGPSRLWLTKLVCLNPLKPT